MKLGVVMNPAAGRRRGLQLADALRAHAHDAGMETEIATSHGAATVPALSARLARGADALVIIGGDGTVHEAVNGIMPEPLPIVILPTGTGNDFANLLGAPATPAAVVACVRDGMAVRVDVLDLGFGYAVNSVGMGFEGLANRLSHQLHRVPGAARYLLAALRALMTLECPEFVIESPEHAERGARLLISVGNGNRVGGGFRLTPDACPDDGLADVCIVDWMRRRRALRLLPSSGRGGHIGQQEVRVIRTPRLRIRIDRDYPIHIDGELLDPGPRDLDITVRPRVLPVLCSENLRGPFRHAPDRLW